jgi:NAD(P)-dependent dehydrogenase (short-subunit alcohol dehydrogenase family)
MLPYISGKFALTGFSHGLRTELLEHGVHVTTVCPGLMRTGSHLHAEFKGQHEREYVWFALGNAIPGLSVSAESAARSILAATARGDAELVIGLPAKLAVAAHALLPNLMDDLAALVNRFVLPAAGGVGTLRIPGRVSRGKLPGAITTLSDRAAERNNETGEGVHPVTSAFPQPG